MLTQARAAEIYPKAQQFPNWGNYTKFMTRDEEDYVRDIFQRAVSGNVSIASIVCNIKNGVEINVRP